MPRSSPILCGSIAGSIGGTGVLLHNAAYQAAGIPYCYVSFEPSGAEAAIAAVRALGIRGLGVTMPYKIEVMQYLDRLDETARQIGAVNTIVNDAGVLTGYNTDWTGAVEGLRAVTEFRGRRAALFGAGGAARAILYGLIREGAQVDLFNRDAQRGRELCARFPNATYAGNMSEFDKTAGYDIVVNATSVGFQSGETLLRAEQFPPEAAVLDVVFKPFDTAFAAEAEKAGCRVVPGYTMLILQALAQDELYTGQRLSYEVMERVLRAKRDATDQK